jgi:5-methylcytosine-specific restriction enzyme subunit McrC
MNQQNSSGGKRICVVYSMTNDKGIYIKNIYYMLSYAFQVLKYSNYESVAAEEFDTVQDLFAAILAKGVAKQLKQGLYREYVTQHEILSVMRGKLDMPETIYNRIQRKQKLACEFDELSENNLFNQILKTTMHYLIRDNGVTREHKIELNKVLVFFDGVTVLEPSSIKWSRLHYQRNNKNYEMLLNICYFVIDGMLQTTEKGEYKMVAFSDEHMARLYEKFILEYYRYHHSYFSEVRAAQVKWDLTGDNNETMIRFLPIMQTDIFLRLKEKILILDAKYYGRTLQKQFDKYTLHSGNIYQIFTYVKNQDKDNTGNVSGMLLYAKTEEDITPDCVFNIGGNKIGAKTLDLNKDFHLIAAQLMQ